MSRISAAERLRLFGTVIRNWDQREDVHFDRDTFEIASDMIAEKVAAGVSRTRAERETLEYLCGRRASALDYSEDTQNMLMLCIKAYSDPIRDWERAK